MRDDRDYKVELSGAAGQAINQSQPVPAVSLRPFISVHFVCCNIYVRIYRDAVYPSAYRRVA